MSQTCRGCQRATASAEGLCPECTATFRRIAEQIAAVANALQSVSDGELDEDGDSGLRSSLDFPLEPC